MKTICLIFLSLLTFSKFKNDTTYNEAYAKALIAKYPITKSNLCDNCYLWINPYYKSIADIEKHYPIVEHYIYTTEHRIAQEKLKLKRIGIFAKWHPVMGQKKVDAIYRQANAETAKPKSAFVIEYGHCGAAWILLAYTKDGAILSNIEDFNEGMEYAGQNIGTQLVTENFTRKLTGWKVKALTDTVSIWAGCYGIKRTYSKNGLTVTIPTYFWKVLVYKNRTVCYWMPNEPTEKQRFLSQRIIGYNELVANIGFDPKSELP